MPHEFDTDTLEDLKQRDIFNLNTILKKKGRLVKSFSLQAEAMHFQGIRVQQIVQKLGINLEQAHKDLNFDIDAELNKRGITVENRIYSTDPTDEWRSGLYFYKDNEIAGFVGHPIFDENDRSKGYEVLCTSQI